MRVCLIVPLKHGMPKLRLSFTLELGHAGDLLGLNIVSPGRPPNPEPAMGALGPEILPKVDMWQQVSPKASSQVLGD